MVSVEELQKLVDEAKKEQVKPLEPPQIIQTTRLLLLPPPLPPRVITQALQEPIAIARTYTGISVQIVSTPIATVT